VASKISEAQKSGALVRSLALLVLALAFLWSEDKGFGQIGSGLVYVLVGGCVYVLTTAFLPIHRLDPRAWERLCLAADVGFISLAVFFSRGAESNYRLLYYLPIVNASLRLRLQEVLEATLLVGVAYLFVVLLRGWIGPEKGGVGPDTLIFLGIGFLVAVLMGTLARENREHVRYKGQVRGLLEELREANARLSEYSRRLERLSVLDPLTGVLNRRGFEQKMEEELRRARRFNRPLSLLLVDMDDLKRYNDRHGHFQGDLALIHVGRVLREGVRGIDVVARYGGDEFVVILPETDDQGARNLGYKLKDSPALVAANWPQMLKENLLLSFGSATFGEHGVTKEELLQRADADMYAAKSTARAKG